MQKSLKKVVGTEKDKKQTSGHPRKRWGDFMGELILSISELDGRLPGTCNRNITPTEEGWRRTRSEALIITQVRPLGQQRLP